MSQNIKDLNWKNLAGIGLGIFVVLAFLELLSGNNSGLGMNMNYGWGMGYPQGGLGNNGLLSSFFLIAVKILWFIFIISLFAGIAISLKKVAANKRKVDLNFIDKILPAGLKCHNCGNSLQPEYKYCPECKAQVNLHCECGQAIQPNWKHCTACGEDTTRK